MASENASKVFAEATADGAKLKLMSEAIIGLFTKHTDYLVTWSVSAALHVIVHGDYTEIPRVEKALSERGFRSNALKAWFTSPKVFGGKAPLKWVIPSDEDKASGVKPHYEYDAEACAALKARYEAEPQAMVALLTSKPYYKLTAENEYKGDNMIAWARAGLKRYTSVKADPVKSVHKNTDLSFLPFLNAAIDEYDQARKAGAAKLN